MWRTVLGILFGLLALVVVVAILYPIFARSSDGHGPSCPSNLKQMALAASQYVQDNDNRMPLVSVNPVSTSTTPFGTPYGWADALQPYLKRTQIFQCPTEPTKAVDPADGVAPNFTDYYYNTNLSGVGLDKIADPSDLLLFGDGNDGTDLTDARYNRNSFPLSWLKDRNMPTFRHLGGANYAFVDGHVKWTPPERISATGRSKSQPYTFAVQ